MSTEEEAYKLFVVYRGVKLHFESDKYSYEAYGGKTGAKLDQFRKAKDKNFFYRLANMLEPKDNLGFMVSNARLKSIKWIGDLDFNEAKNVYNAWCSTMMNMKRTFKNDVRHLALIADFPEWIQIPENSTYPLICREAMDGNITLETCTIIGKMLDCIPDLQANEDFFWPDWKKRMLKYAAFLKPDLREYAKILKGELQEIRPDTYSAPEANNKAQKN